MCVHVHALYKLMFSLSACTAGEDAVRSSHRPQHRRHLGWHYQLRAVDSNVREDGAGARDAGGGRFGPFGWWEVWAVLGCRAGVLGGSRAAAQGLCPGPSPSHCSVADLIAGVLASACAADNVCLPVGPQGCRVEGGDAWRHFVRGRADQAAPQTDHAEAARRKRPKVHRQADVVSRVRCNGGLPGLRGRGAGERGHAGLYV